MTAAQVGRPPAPARCRERESGAGQGAGVGPAVTLTPTLAGGGAGEPGHLAVELPRPLAGEGRGEGATSARLDRAWRLLDTVLDPEVPVLSVRDLGLVRDVRAADDGSIEVVVTPTYSGCPATEAIERSIVEALEAGGCAPVRVRLQRAPAWTTDWISAEGQRKLAEYGIAPPGPVPPSAGLPIRIVRRPPPLACPRCASRDTEELAGFGATACKSLWRCRACGEPFEHFKPI